MSQDLLTELRQERALRLVSDQLVDPALALHVPELWRLQRSFGGPIVGGGVDWERKFCNSLLAVAVGEIVVGLVAISGAEIPEALVKEPGIRVLRDRICLWLTAGST